MTREQLGTPDARTAGQIRAEGKAPHVMPLREISGDFGKLEQLPKIAQGVRVVEDSAIRRTKDPLVSVPAQVFLEYPQALDADRYPALPSLTAHRDQPRARVNVASENADALPEAYRSVEHQSEHRQRSPHGRGFWLAPQHRDCLPLVKHRLAGLLLWDVRNPEAVNVTTVSKPVARHLPSADVVIRSPDAQPRFPHRYNGGLDRFQCCRQAPALERYPALAVESDRRRAGTVKHFTFADENIEQI